jgi:hypothetical protein
MFINTKKAIRITDDKSREAFEAKAGWIGEVPGWVEKHWFFKALCDDGTVTALVSTRDKDIQAAVEGGGETGGGGEPKPVGRPKGQGK